MRKLMANNKNFIFPCFVTLLGMFSGFYGIIAALNGKYVIAAYAIILALVFDSIDGKVARMLNAQSDFGIQIDSIADVISFGVAPAILVYNWVLVDYGRIGWMAAFLFVACGALRLARFNVQTKEIDNTYFVGLPIPAAAGMIAASVLFAKELFGNPADITIPIWFALTIYILAFLMVSNVPYYSFKNLTTLKSNPFKLMVGFVLFIFTLGLYPEIFLFLIALLYVLSGLFLLLYKRANAKHPKEEADFLS